MATSTSTLLEVINQVLLNVGERELPNIANFVTARKALNSLKAAVNEINVSNDWLFLRDVVQADSWVLNEATLPSHSKLLSVLASYDGASYYVVSQVPLVRFLMCSLIPFATNRTIPEMYAVKNDAVVLLNPYPVEVEDRERLRFQILRRIEIPTTDGGFFNVPEEFIQLIVYKTSSLFATAHTGELDVSARYAQLYESVEMKSRNFYRGVNESQRNAFQIRTRRHTL